MRAIVRKKKEEEEKKKNALSNHFTVGKSPLLIFYQMHPRSVRKQYSLFLFICPEFTTILWPYFF